MHDKVMGADDADDEFVTNAARDARDQAEVLREVLGFFPETLTLDELIRELTVASNESRYTHLLPGEAAPALELQEPTGCGVHGRSRRR